MGTVFAGETVHKYLEFLPEIILYLVVVRSQVMIGANVSDQNGIVDLHRGSLLLKAEVGVDVINDPSVVESVLFGCERGLLLS